MISWAFVWLVSKSKIASGLFVLFLMGGIFDCIIVAMICDTVRAVMK